MIGGLVKLGQLLSRSERRHSLLVLGLMVVGMTLETAGTGLVFPAIALMMQPNLASRYPRVRPLLEALGNPSQAELVVIAMTGLVAVYFVKNLFLTFLAWRQTRFGYDFQVRLSQQLFTIYLRQPYTFHLQRNSAQLIRNVAGEVGMVGEALIRGLNVGTELLVLLGISCLLLNVEPIGTLVAALVLGISGWIFHRVTHARLLRWGATRHLHDVLRYQHLQQGLGGVKDVKLLGREGEFIDQYHIHNMKTARISQYVATLQMLPRLWLELLAVLGLATLVMVMLAQHREMAAIFPTLGLFAAAAFRLLPSVNRLISGLQMLRYAQPVVETLHKELELAPVTEGDGGRQRVRETAEFRSDICLRNVGFAYPGTPESAIKDVSIHIRKSESIGFVGSSGSGKSTLIDVILGLLAPTTGTVEVDGRDIQDDLRAWQSQIGYVPQSIYLTDDTLRRNVAFGLPENDIDNEAVERAIRAAQLEDFVAGLPNGLNTIVGERGVRLSGGQRQRIGIARALYHDPAVLVLDEATSSLDMETESGVMQAVAALHGTKTLLIVAHRLSTVDDCDRLYRLEKGRIAEKIVESPPAWAPKSARTTNA